jgi:hypothetical protein
MKGNQIIKNARGRAEQFDKGQKLWADVYNEIIVKILT